MAARIATCGPPRAALLTVEPASSAGPEPAVAPSPWRAGASVAGVFLQEALRWLRNIRLGDTNFHRGGVPCADNLCKCTRGLPRTVTTWKVVARPCGDSLWRPVERYQDHAPPSFSG